MRGRGVVSEYPPCSKYYFHALKLGARAVLTLTIKVEQAQAPSLVALALYIPHAVLTILWIVDI